MSIESQISLNHLGWRDVSCIRRCMPCRRSASSLHYDPFENLLCLISGTKTVRCFSPEATPGMYPLPLYGESSNHSSVSFSAPDLKLHPLYAVALKSMQTADLQVSSHTAQFPGHAFWELGLPKKPTPADCLSLHSLWASK